MSENITVTGDGEVVSAVTDDGEDCTVVNPSATFLDYLMEELGEDSGEVRVVAQSDALKSLRRDFVIASNAANRVEEDALELRQTEKFVSGGVVVAGDMMAGIIELDDSTIVTEAQDTDGGVDEAVESMWEESEEFSLRTPSITRVYDSLSDELGEEVSADFQAVVEATGEDTSESFDEVAAALLVGAKHEQLLYDISKWGEDTGMASKATFSRTKSLLEENGLVETEKVPIDVGRPRLRLKLAGDAEDSDVEEIVELIQAEPAIAA